MQERHRNMYDIKLRHSKIRKKCSAESRCSLIFIVSRRARRYCVYVAKCIHYSHGECTLYDALLLPSTRLAEIHSVGKLTTFY